MSTDWNIRCVDCNVVHKFDDANHQDDLMVILIKHRDAIAALAPLLTECRDIEFRVYYGGIDAAWFAAHAGHKLIPHDEYGRDLDQCRDRVDCASCGANHHCTLPYEHEGPHEHRPEDRR